MKETGYFRDSRRSSMDEGQDTGGKGGGEVREKTNCCLNPSHLESAEVSKLLPASLADVRIGLVELRPATAVFVTTTHSSPHSHHESTEGTFSSTSPRARQ